MAYVEQTWTDGSGGGTPISAARLSHMEDGIKGAADAAAAAVQPATIVNMVTSTTTTAIWTGTQAAYDGLTPDSGTIYVVSG